MANNADLSSLDYTNVIRDSHNEPAHALNVVEVNSLVPARFSKVELEYITSGNGIGEVGVANYYSDAAYETTKISVRGDNLGSAHKTKVYFLNRKPEQLAGKAFQIHDNGGGIAVWYNVDSLNTQPIDAGVYRYIEVNILSSDNHEQIAQKTALTIDADASFIAIYTSFIVLISNNSSGIRPDSVNIDAQLTIKNVSGSNPTPLNSKYFLINSATDTDQYYVWYNVGGTGVDPTVGGKTGLMVAIPNGASETQVANSTKIVLDSTTKFITNISDGILSVRTKLIGVTTMSSDYNTSFFIQREKEGLDRQLLVTLILTYNGSNELVSAERL
jgi:hypothetical protein